MMWLVYLRFNDGQQGTTTFVRCNNKNEVQQVIYLADQHGLTPAARLFEYASFYARGTIKTGMGPNSMAYHFDEFVRRWNRATAED